MSTRRAFDVVVVGTGAAGITAAIRAHDLGLRVAIVEAADKVGGATAFSGAQVWVGGNHVMERNGLADTVEETRDYMLDISSGASCLDVPVFEQWTEEAPRVMAAVEEAGAVEWTYVAGLPDYYFPGAAGSKGEGRYLTCASIKGSALGDRRAQLLAGPHFPPGPTWAEVAEVHGDERRLQELVSARMADDILTLGAGLAAHLIRAVDAREVPVMLEHRATDLVVDDSGAVTGVVCATPAGPATFGGTVLLATGTYDWNMALVKEYTGLDPEDTGSVAPPSIRGDGIALGRQAGARIFDMPRESAVQVVGYKAAEPHGDDAGYRFCLQLSYPHSLMVNRHGRRFCDDSFYRSVSAPLLSEGGSEQLPFFLIWDETHHQQYGLYPAGPGEPYPDAMETVCAETIGGVATALGIDADELSSTVQRFNEGARAGVDPEFHRGENTWATTFLGDPNHHPCPVLGPVERPPFFGMRMRLLGTAAGNAGVHAGLHGQALDSAGQPIAGLYAIGSASAFTSSGTGYNSGICIGRAMTFGHLAAEHVHAQLAAEAGVDASSR